MADASARISPPSSSCFHAWEGAGFPWGSGGAVAAFLACDATSRAPHPPGRCLVLDSGRGSFRDPASFATSFTSVLVLATRISLQTSAGRAPLLLFPFSCSQSAFASYRETAVPNILHPCLLPASGLVGANPSHSPFTCFSPLDCFTSWRDSRGEHCTFFPPGSHRLLQRSCT